MKSTPSIALFAALIVVSVPAPTAAGGVPESVEPQTPVLYASVAPQAYFVRAIAGGFAEVRPIIQPGQDAHSYDPSPREIQRLSRAGAVFVTGLEFEARILGALTASNPDLAVVDLRTGITLRDLEDHAHENGDAADNDHGGEPSNPDFHIWLGPREVLVQAATIRDALTALFPDHRAEISAGYRALVAEIEEVTAELDALLEPLAGETVLVYHPAFGYLTDTYGIRQVAIESGGREPTIRGLEHSIAEARESGARLILTQPEYAGTSARAVAQAIGARVVTVYSLDEDWPALMRGLGAAFGQIGER